ncbi:MAG: DUF2937 family protein [Pseudomonadota bacterium]
MRKSVFLLFGCAGALLFSQFPEFFQQYTQRLGGHLDEVTAQVSALERRADESGKALTVYLRGLQLHRDADVRREGYALRDMVERKDMLAQSYDALTGAQNWWRAGQFAKHMDWEIAGSALSVYRPAMPVTPEAAIYAGAGFGGGAIVYFTLLGLIGPRERSRAARRREET